MLLGYDSVTGYENDSAYFGALIGRYETELRQAVSLDGTDYPLTDNSTANDLPCHLHGAVGFDRKVWHAEAVQTVTRRA